MGKTEENLSKWQERVNKRHPLVCQICTRVISGLIVAALVAWWGVNNIPARPVERIIPSKTTDSSEINVRNEGFFPANIIYSVISPDAATIQANIQEGGPYASIENTQDNNVKLLHINNLPLNKSVKVRIIGSDVVELKK